MKHLQTVLRSRLLILLLSLLAISLLLAVGARASALWSVQSVLQRELPPVVNAALVNAHDEAQALARMEQQLQTALTFTLQPLAGVRLIDDIRPGKLQLSTTPPASVLDSGWRHETLQLAWPYGEGVMQAQLTLELIPAWPALLLAALVISLILQLVLEVLPGSRWALAGAWRQHFRQQGYAPAQAAQLASEVSADPEALVWAQTLAQDKGQGELPLSDCLLLARNTDWRAFSAEQLDWFRLALLRGLSADEAARVAIHDSSLSFDLAARQVQVHGLTLGMAPTPLFYYFWYARRCALGLGLYVNPAVNRPDEREGHWLADLMEAHGGHAKAINDLRDSGLKGKTLDQNRNKIKDELTRALGDLAAAFLFQAERDMATARYRYGLTLSPASLCSGGQTSFRDISERTERSYSQLSNTPA
ncbi:hypothetical protein ACQUQU_15205 [Thalassolituus sp. LLYu03]|uniref:hypothetical protein n=1 Tax=Thalassolituus sp. LLYu03 TaxID=3421656 RepID=UPI003D2A1823